MRSSKKYDTQQGKKVWTNKDFSDKQYGQISRVLKEVKSNYSNTIQFIEDCLEQERSKENISVDGVIFLFTSQEAKG